MNFNFEGNYKPRRNINLGGVRTQTDKQALMAKAQSERKLRERERLRLRGATKIQSFYRGRKVAAALHDRQRIEFGDSISQIASLTRSSELDCPTDCAQALQLIHALLQRWQMQDTVFIHLFLQYDEDEEIDSTLWLFKLLIKKVLLPLALTEESDYTCPALHLLSTIMDPDVYASIESKDAAFSSHEVFVSIITYCTLNTRLFHVMRHLLLSFNIPPERCHAVTTILSHLLSAQPPFTYHSAILSRYPLPTPSAMGLFSYTPSKSTRTPPSKHTEISQQLLAEKLVIHILTVPFLMDRMPKDDITQILRHVTLDTIFNTVVVSYNNEEWKDYMNPDSIALLLVNLNQMIPIQSDFSPSIYTDAVQLLLAALPSIYFVDPEHQSADKMRMMYSDSDDDSDEEDVAMIESIKVDDGITSRLFSLYDKESMGTLMTWLRHQLAQQSSHDHVAELVGPFANLFQTIMTRWPSKKDMILNSLLYHRWRTADPQLSESFASIVWQAWQNSGTSSMFNNDEPIMSKLNEAAQKLTDEVTASHWSLLFLLCEILARHLLTIGDDEFFDKSGSTNQLSLSQMVELSTQLKNIAFVLFWRAGALDMDHPLSTTGIHLGQLRTAVTTLLQQIHMRDSRRVFCPLGHWLIPGLDTDSFSTEAVAEEFSLESTNDGTANVRQPSKSQLAMISPRLGLLNNIPFVIPFEDRVKIFRMFVENDRRRNGIDDLRRISLDREIRRHHVFEDGFASLYGLGSELKRKIAITFVDEFGLQEAGIDGGGVFKEFLTSLGHEAFDTNYGLFLATPDQMLYPNSSRYATEPDQLAYYEFLGLIIGKALYEGVLLDVAFADFFLKRCLGRVNYLDDLPSLDPELYNGLIQVKNFQGDVEDLCLDFTLTRDELGQSETVELIPGGTHIPVTNTNRIRYVYLVADYRLNVQIAKQSKAFHRGLSTIIDIKWLRMFNQQELQVLLGGAYVPIDLEDLRLHTVYAGYTDKDRVVQDFWRALCSFNNEERMKFVKFVTSCSRPPLLGFKELTPQFCIRRGEADDNRLPTSSTCVNLLKLPPFSSYSILRQKLVYAITAEAGFDLS